MTENTFTDRSAGGSAEFRDTQAPYKDVSMHRSKNDGAKMRRLVFACAASTLCTAFAALFIVRGSIKKDHLAAVDEYNANNFIRIEKNESGCSHVFGSRAGQAFEYVEDGTYCEGISINDVDISGLTYSEARSLLLGKISEELLTFNMSLNVGNMKLMLNSGSFIITTDLDVVLHDAFALGRSYETDPYVNYLERMDIASNGRALNYSYFINEESVRQRVAALAAAVDAAATEPYVTLKNLLGGGRVGNVGSGITHDVYDSETIYAPNGAPIAELVFHNGTNGYVLDQEKLVQSIIAAFNAGERNAHLEAYSNEISPKSSAMELKASVGMLSSFSTQFTSSSDFRARNVQKANALLNCIIMAPGQELSYNELLGPRTEAGGWLQAPGISGGKEYVDSPGGGICQISTTLYNALLLLGDDVEIISRRHHSIPGSYVDLGLDATVSTGGPDLVWSAATDTPLYLLTYTDMDTRTAYVYVYGQKRKDGCTYKVWSETVQVVKPEEPKRIAEPLWPTGYSKTVITPRNGYVVNVYRQKLASDGTPMESPKRLYQDVYSSVRGEVHYGTGDPNLPKP